MSISLTDSAATRVRTYLEKRGRAWDCGSACARAAATAGRTRSTTPIAWRPRTSSSKQGGVKVIVAAETLELIDGTEVDFIKDGLNEAFKFRNPNVKGECGCGESFSV